MAPLWSTAARATGDDAATEEGRKLYRKWIRAYTELRYEDARISFSEVYERKPNEVEVLRELGAAEVRSGHPVQGAQHLDDWLRLSTKGTDEEREAVQALLSEAKQSVGALQIVADPSGADITVDDRSAGRSPLDHDVFVTPGRHLVRARYEEAQADGSVIATAGIVTALTLSPRRPALANAAATETGGKRREKIPVERASGSTAPANLSMPTKSAGQPLALREQRACALLLGGGIALACAVLGTVSIRSANQADTDANALDALARVQSPCGDACPESGYAHDARNEAQRSRVAAVASFSIAGIAALGAVAYFLWVPKKPRLHVVRARSSRDDHSCLPGMDSVSDCADLFKSNRDYDEHRAVGIAGFALAGAAALGTTAYLIWPDSSLSTPVHATVGFNGRNRTLVFVGKF